MLTADVAAALAPTFAGALLGHQLAALVREVGESRAYARALRRLDRLGPPAGGRDQSETAVPMLKERPCRRRDD